MTLGQRIKELRIARNLTQAQVAEGINCSSAAYSRYENDERQPSMDVLAKLGDYFGVSMDYLFGKTPLVETALSDYEIELVRTMRSTTDAVREDIFDLLRIKIEKSEAPK